jgi:hypothetical protein
MYIKSINVNFNIIVYKDSNTKIIYLYYYNDEHKLLIEFNNLHVISAYAIDIPNLIKILTINIDYITIDDDYYYLYNNGELLFKYNDDLYCSHNFEFNSQFIINLNLNYFKKILESSIRINKIKNLC